MASILRMLYGIVAAMLIFSACSTTKRLSDGEVLYTGVKKININSTQGEKLPSVMLSDIKSAVNVKPNNPMPFLSPYVRTPFPVGLWVYNNWNDSAKGLKGWLYKKLVREPVLISDVRPATRCEMIRSVLDRNGYFKADASYSLLYDKRNPKKARIRYDVAVGAPYTLDSIMLLPDTTRLNHFIDSLAAKSKYLVDGERFCIDSLEAERVRIANVLRNRGYYYFRPEYIEFLADSLITPGRIALKMTLAANMPEISRRRFTVGNVHTYVLRRSTRDPGTPDTIITPRTDLVVMRPSHLRPNLVPSCITFRKGRLFRVRDMDRTQARLSRLGIFSNIQIQAVPADSLMRDSVLDVFITCQFDRPMEASVEVNASSKSNSYIGPGLILGLTHNNLFGGAEKLNIQLNADYEWQTGRNRGSVFNSYEFGLTASLAFPRLLAPRFIRRSQRDINWTTITLSGDVINRPHFFKMAKFDLGIAYDWRETRYSQHSFTPFKLTYTKLMRTTHDFDSIMAENPAVALSFESQYIPQLSYTYTYDRFFERSRINGITFTATVMEAGNLFDVIYRACGVKGKKELFGTPFSQFIKGQAQLVYQRRLIPGKEQWIVSRVLIGAEHAYGNSVTVPYSEQFYIGGANSIRAFTVRSIGPGSYRAPKSLKNGYFDQTGTCKLELNCEYRFPIISVLHGAAFLDAGNIWVLRNDPTRPGARLQGKTFLRDLALGTGVGLRVDIGVMVIRGDLGYGLHTPYRNGTPHYFNVRFKDAFAFHLAIGYPF